MASGKRLSEALEEYLRIQQARAGGGHRGENTAKADNNVLRMFLRMSGDRMLPNLTAKHVQNWFYGPGGVRDWHKINSRRAGKDGMSPPISAATHNHYRSRLLMFFKWCIAMGYMKADVMALVDPLPLEKKTRQRPSAITLTALLDNAANPRDRCYLAVAMNTGLRSSDMRMLTVGDVDLVDGWLSTRIRKTKDADEKPISKDMEKELRTWLAIYEEDLGRPLRDDDYLFPRRGGGMYSHVDYDNDGMPFMVRAPYTWLPKAYIRDTHLIVQKAMKSLNMPTYKEGTHTIRRAIGRAYFDWVAAEKGESAALRETATFLNHSSMASTEIYIGLDKDRERRDKRVRNKPFLSAMVEAQIAEEQDDKVTPIRKAVGE